VKAFQRNELVSSDLSNIQWKKFDICCFSFTSCTLLPSCGGVCESLATTACVSVTKALCARRIGKQSTAIYVSIARCFWRTDTQKCCSATYKHQCM